ncbi:MAG: hypothetical protein EPO68_15440 [Planctomycetota bacterium]|nr:MAG: hypothetical protein EPO68_15440 [Planctomycetota bacterium]
MVGKSVIASSALVASIGTLASISAALQRTPVAAAPPDPSLVYVRFIDVDTGTDLAINTVRSGLSAQRFERYGDLDPRPDLWRVWWTDRHGVDISVPGYECMGLVPLTSVHADPGSPFRLPLRATRRLKLWIQDEQGAVKEGRVLSRRSSHELHTRWLVEFETPALRHESAAAQGPVRVVGGVARDVWARPPDGCGLGAIGTSGPLPHVAFGTRPVDIWVAPPHADRDAIARHERALPANDLPRYLGRYLEAGDDRSELRAKLPRLVGLRGRVYAPDMQTVAGGSVQLCLCDETFARGPRNSIPDSPGTRANIGDDGGFEFPAIPPGPYWIGCVRDGAAIGPFQRFDVPIEGQRDAFVSLTAATFEPDPDWLSSRRTELSDLFRAWLEFADGDRGFTVTLTSPGASPDTVTYRLSRYNPFVPAANEWKSGRMIVRTRRDRIAVAELAALHNQSPDPARWSIDWQAGARIWLVWNGVERAARFDVRANGVLVERCWLEPGDVRELLAPPGELIVTTRPQDGETREQRATLESHGQWIVRER